MVNTPNYRGVFLRGYGNRTHAQQNGTKTGKTNTAHASGAIGAIQGDSMRVLSGSIVPLIHNGAAMLTDSQSGLIDGVTTTNPVQIATYITNTNGKFGIVFDNRWTTPVANENRPVNIAVRYLIKTR